MCRTLSWVHGIDIFNKYHDASFSANDVKHILLNSFYNWNNIFDIDNRIWCILVFIKRVYTLTVNPMTAERWTKKNWTHVFLDHIPSFPHLGIMGWMTNTSASTQSRLFVAWSIFLVTVFESIDLSPLLTWWASSIHAKGLSWCWLWRHFLFGWLYRDTSQLQRILMSIM